MKEQREREAVNLGQPRRSFSPTVRQTGGVRGLAWVVENGGDRGDWTTVRSRKRKVTQPEARRWDISVVSEPRGGTAQVRVRDQRATEDYERRSRHHSRSRQYGFCPRGRVSNEQGVRVSEADNTCNNVSFYFTSFPEFMSVYQLRHFFEVCGILSDVYIARKRNF